jgi:hypothetical protein
MFGCWISIEKSFPFYSICAVRPESSWPSSSPYVHLWILATDIFLVALVFDSRATVSSWFFLPLSAHSLLPSDFPAAIFIRAPVSSRFLAAGAVWPDPIFCRCLNFLVAVFGGKPAQGSQSPARPSVCLRGAHQADDFLFCLGSQVFRVRSRFSISARLINFTRHVSIRFLSQVQNPFMPSVRGAHRFFQFCFKFSCVDCCRSSSGITFELPDEKLKVS